MVWYISINNYDIELVFHESENCKNQLQTTIEAINEKLLLEIFKIKNPNETIYELMKIVFLILSENSNNLSISVNSGNISWLFLQSNFKSAYNISAIKKDLNDLLIKDISKDLIDQSMPFNLKYSEIKVSLAKINKNLVIVLDLVKYVVDFNIKKNMVKNLYTSNLNKNGKLMAIKEEIQGKEILVKEASEYLSTMQSELTSLLTQKNSVNLYRHIVNNYDFVEKYKVFVDNDSRGDYNRPKVTIKLKGKYKSREAFVRTVLEAKARSMSNMRENQNQSNNISQNTSLPKLKLPRTYTSNIENTSTRSRNIHNHIYASNLASSAHNNIPQANPFILSSGHGQSKVYYTSERAKKDNLSISLKQRSIGSTIYKDIETLENIIKDEKSFDVIPLNCAIKPVPKPLDVISEVKRGDKVGEEENINYNRDNISLIEDIIPVPVHVPVISEQQISEANQNQEGKKIISVLEEIKKENDSNGIIRQHSTPNNILR